MSDELQKLILEVQGRDKLEALNSALAAEQKALRDLSADLRTGAMSQAAFDAAAAKSGASVLALQAQIKALAGGGIGGGGILQASYAVQDFTSVLMGGQGLGRALASIQNNIPGLLMSLGAGGGLAGIVSLVSVGIGSLTPLLEKMWGAMENKEAAESAKQRLRELKAQIEATHKAFRALAETPTDVERLSAEGFRMFFEKRPNAEKGAAAIAAGIGEEEARGALTPEELQQYSAAHRSALQGEEDLAREARAQAGREFAGMGGEGQAPQQMVDAALAAQRQAREAARAERRRLLGIGRTRRGEAVVAGALTPGPAGAASREEVLRKTRGVAGLEELQQYDPGKIQLAEQEYEAQQEADEAEAERVQQYRENRRKALAAAKHRATQRAHLQRQQTEAILATHTQAIKAEQHEDAAEAADRDTADARNLSAYQRGKRQRPHNQARAGVVDMLRQGGGQMPPEMIDQAADQTLSLMRQGMSQQAATWLSINSKMQAMRQAMQIYQAEQARMMMGSDYNGQMPLLP
jgi:hypothetical protein